MSKDDESINHAEEAAKYGSATEAAIFRELAPIFKSMGRTEETGFLMQRNMASLMTLTIVEILEDLCKIIRSMDSKGFPTDSTMQARLNQLATMKHILRS